MGYGNKLMMMSKSLLTLAVYLAASFAFRSSSRSPRSLFKLYEVINQSEIGLNINEYPTDDYSHILGINDPTHTPSKLQKICQIRMKDVEHSKTPLDVQGCGIDRSFYISEEDFMREIQDFDEEYGKPLNLMNRIAAVYPKMAIAAEFKRASPSKGDINPNADVVEQCLQYASVGAAVISVLTEYKHFKGTLTDMKKVRIATQTQLKENRPAILRKDFILDRYQLYEARAHGADTVLLIVAVLGVNQLKDLIAVCRKLGMEPLVEVHTQREMEIALDCGAKTIGVNNRNLHTFQLDLDTTAKSIAIAETKGVSWRPTEQTGAQLPDVQIFALSGITSSEDVAQFKDLGVSCCLIGEALMKAPDPAAMVRELLGENTGGNAGKTKAPLVKVCGITSAADASIALQNGANFIGVIFAPKSPRKVSLSQAKEIVQIVQKYGERTAPISLSKELEVMKSDRLSPKLWFSRISASLEKITLRRPLVVGVFQDQSVEEINNAIQECGLDLVQLHGDENIEYISRIHAPCLKVVHIPLEESSSSSSSQVETHLSPYIASLAGHTVGIILDTSVKGDKSGGTGATFDWSIAEKLGMPVFLAGGLNPANVQAARKLSSIIGIDVSSGIEVPGQPGVKDHKRVEAFLRKE